MKLNLGCGTDHRVGYVNVDIRRNVGADRVCDVRDLSWLADQSVEEILARDVIEHVPWREIHRVLGEWFRVLIRGGLLRLQLPNLEYLAWRYLQKNDTAELIRWIYGDQDYAENTHRSGFDRESLRAALEREGFEVMALGTDGGANILCAAQKPKPETRNR